MKGGMPLNMSFLKSKVDGSGYGGDWAFRLGVQTDNTCLTFLLLSEDRTEVSHLHGKQIKATRRASIDSIFSRFFELECIQIASQATDSYFPEIARCFEVFHA